RLYVLCGASSVVVVFFHAPAAPPRHALSLPDALPISAARRARDHRCVVAAVDRDRDLLGGAVGGVHGEAVAQLVTVVEPLHRGGADVDAAAPHPIPDHLVAALAIVARRPGGDRLEGLG